MTLRLQLQLQGVIKNRALGACGGTDGENTEAIKPTAAHETSQRMRYAGRRLQLSDAVLCQ